MPLDLVLINPPLTMEERYGKFAALGSNTPNLGLCYLASSVRNSGFSVKIIDAPTLFFDMYQPVSLINESKPGFIGIIASTVSIVRANNLARAVKEAGNKEPVLIGGAHVSSLPLETLREFPSFDIGVINDGELTVLDILHSNSKPDELEKIAGIVFQRDGEAFLTAPKGPIKDIDVLPYPAFDLLPDLAKHYRPASHSYLKLPSSALISSRGCNGSCSFCARPFIGERYRGHSAEYTLGMIDMLVKDYGIKDIIFYDDNFLLDKKRVEKICEGLLQRNYGLSWSCLARNETVSSDYMNLIKKAGCWQIALGIESGDQQILDNLNKKTTVEKNRRAIELINRAGIHSRGYFMIGCPGETVESINRTLGFIRTSGLKDFHSTFCTPMPGSKLFENADSFGTFYRDWKKLGFWEPAFIPEGLTVKQLISMHRKMYRVFYLKPRIVFRYLMSGFRNPLRMLGYIKSGLPVFSYIFKNKK